MKWSWNTPKKKKKKKKKLIDGGFSGSKWISVMSTVKGETLPHNVCRYEFISESLFSFIRRITRGDMVPHGPQAAWDSSINNNNNNTINEQIGRSQKIKNKLNLGENII